MQYYVSEFAPITVDEIDFVQSIISNGEQIGLIFVNDTMGDFEQKLYVSHIIQEIGLTPEKGDIQQFSLDELPLTFLSEQQTTMSHLLKCFKQLDHLNVLEKKNIYGYEDQLFADTHIFDDITESTAKYIIKNELFQIDKHISLIFNAMSYRRFQHSMRVVYQMMRLASIYTHIDANYAYLTAVYHDYAKELPIDEQRFYVDRYFPEYTDVPSPAYHGFAAAIQLQQMDDSLDEDIYEAIAFHPIGIPHYAELGLMLFTADYCDYRRPHTESWQPVWKAAQTDLYEAAYIRIMKTKTFFDSTEKSLYWTTENMLQWLEEMKK